jgi:glutamate--cysteine ligase
MSEVFESRLKALAALSGEVLGGGLRGVEKECLRVEPTGTLSMRTHPKGLGSALTNQYITTDYSEALLEFVTPAFETTWEALLCLCDIHQFTYENLDDELLWASSMPCLIPGDSEIPLARYGSSNVGQMKTIYRRGLGYRYGRPMQTIAGVHFNYSLPAGFWGHYRDIVCVNCDKDHVRSAQYLGLIRNFRRFGWLILYLFGSSPAVCKSFAGGAEFGMPTLNDHTWYEPYSTSLRMSDLGYSNQNQARIDISLNSLGEYVADLSTAINTPEPSYEEIGVNVDGVWRQLNANLLQIENEYYSPIRPKRVARSGERPTTALLRGGVEYVEVRSLDINMFDPAGINQNTMRFMEAFLIYCLIEDSPPFDDRSLDEAKRNHTVTARYGRDPDLRLARDGGEVGLRDWAREILDKVIAVAALIDAEEETDCYGPAVRKMQARVADAERTPSARLLAELREADCSFFEFALETAKHHRNYFQQIAPMPAERKKVLEDEAADSLSRQASIEAADDISLDDYLARYFAGD